MKNTLSISENIAAGLYHDSGDVLPHLAKQIEIELEKILIIENLPPNLTEHFSEDPFETGEPLSTWCGEKFGKGEFSEDIFKVLSAIAQYLDICSDCASPLLAFVPEWFSINGEGKIIISRPLLKLASPDKELIRLNNFQRSFLKPYLHPSLLKNLKNCNYKTVMVFSFTLFLMNLFLDVRGQSIAELKDGLKKCGMKNPKIPPGLAENFFEILVIPPNQENKISCEELVDSACRFFNENPFNYNDRVDQQLQHDVFGYSVPGLNKRMNSNEDKFLSQTFNNITFFLVADGVSTADIGTGEIAAEEVVRLFKTEFFTKFKKLASHMEKDLADDPAFKWYEMADDFLSRFFLEACQRVTQQLNALKETGNYPPPFKAPMCTTLSAGVVVYDQAAVRYAGDSPVLLYSPKRDIFRKLTVDHHHGLEQNFTMTSCPDSEALTRVIGAKGFSKDKNLFLPACEKGDPLRIQLEKEDLLLLASDGLIDCIDALTPELKAGAAEKQIRSLVKEKSHLKTIVREMVMLGENGLSNDNITLNLLHLDLKKEK